MDVIPKDISSNVIEVASLSKEAWATAKKDLAKKAPTSGRLCQLLTVQLTGDGLSINWCKPVSLRLGNMDEGATFQLFTYGRLEPLQAYLNIYRDGDMWFSELKKTH